VKNRIVCRIRRRGIFAGEGARKEARPRGILPEKVWQTAPAGFLQFFEQPPCFGRNLSIRYEPGIHGLLKKRVEGGTMLQVIDGPVILDDVRWWKVQRADGLTGWAAEGSKRERWLSPME